MRLTMKINGITGRWLTNIFSIIVAALIIVEIAVIILSNTGIDNSVNDYMNSRATLFRKYFNEYIKDNSYDFELTANELITLADDADTVKIQIFSADGTILVTSDGYATNEKAHITSSASVMKYRDKSTGERLISLTVPLQDSFGSVLGGVRLISSLRKVNLQKTVFTVISLLLGFLTLGLVAMSGTYFINSIVNPIKQIAATSKIISKGYFSSRIEKKNDDEIGELTDSINNMAADLSKLDQMKNDFISSVSHELRTPLTAIKGWDETLMSCDPDKDADTVKMGLEIIASESDRLSKMVEELLDYSKIQNGKITMVFRQVDLKALLSGTVLMFKEKAAQRGIKLIYREPTFSMMAEGDPSRLKQVFVNVIDNAIKHSFENSEIVISASLLEGGYEITVLDHGEGIRAEDLPNIKKRFYKGKSTAPGSGLGLAISDSVIALHGGYLDIYSKEGKGTTVVISLPEKVPKKLKKPDAVIPLPEETPQSLKKTD